MEPKVLPGKLTIGKVQCSTGRSYISIKVEDHISGCQVVDVKVELKEFAEAITGLAYRECELEIFPNAPIGKKPEYKTEFIEFKPKHFKGEAAEKEKEQALAPFEVDGWSCTYLGGLGNMHRYVKKEDGREGYNINFIRFID